MSRGCRLWLGDVIFRGESYCLCQQRYHPDISCRRHGCVCHFHYCNKSYRNLFSATRIIAAWYYLHQDNAGYPKTNFDAFHPDNQITNAHIDVQDDHYQLVREMGAASTVLLKNTNNTLPLNKPRSIVLIGSDAGGGISGPNQFADQVSNPSILAVNMEF